MFLTHVREEFQMFTDNANCHSVSGCWNQSKQFYHFVEAVGALG